VEGYDVVTNDGSTLGRVVAVAGDHLVVQHGALRKHRNALPLELVHADDDARVVRTTIGKETLARAPEVGDDGSIDARAVALYYGSGEGGATPESAGDEDVSVEGYDVVTNDDHRAGHAVRTTGRYVIVEHGTLRKHRKAIPLALASVDHGARTVRATVSRNVLDEAPELEGDSVDENAVAGYFGLAEGFAAPSTAGYGEALPDDPGLSADEDARRLGLPTADEQRLRVRDRMRPEERDPTADSPGRQIHPDRWSTGEDR
jgi:hypothetical protein